MTNTEKYLTLSSKELKSFIKLYHSVLIRKYRGIDLEYVSLMYPKARKEMEQKGVNPDTLNLFEETLKKILAGVKEPRPDEVAEIGGTIADEILSNAMAQAKKEGRTLIILSDDDEKED